MSKSLKGTQTEKNILTAFAGESQARNRYTYYAKQARTEGYVQIADIFTETANQEMEHAKVLFKFLEGGDVEITAAFPAGRIGTTAENLQEAACGEHHEWEQMYPEYAQIAQDEGFPEVARAMKAIAVAEKQHERRYLALLKNIQEGRVFVRSEKITWRCLNCGYVHSGTKAAERCPACDHPQAHFEELAENW
ncbi:MAG: rubrerythrin family protein [Desulfovibrionales bacterium]|nr:rubrerythrin family protein [Desulfovibrionales bacterium]